MSEVESTAQRALAEWYCRKHGVTLENYDESWVRVRSTLEGASVPWAQVFRELGREKVAAHTR